LVDDLLLLAYLDQERPRVRAPGRPMEYAGPLFVDVDADGMRQVLANLLGNALALTPA
jgi:signal transduction histidine kinase